MKYLMLCGVETRTFSASKNAHENVEVDHRAPLKKSIKNEERKDTELS